MGQFGTAPRRRRAGGPAGPDPVGRGVLRRARYACPVPDQPGPEWNLLRRVDRPGAYVSVLTTAGVVAVGRAVAETGWAGVFGMATLPDARGRGAARGVLAALARWAAENGAGRMYLQVEDDNAAARRLYERAGFAELCRYHYRTEHPDSRDHLQSLLSD
ncbi:GNAT family N-acetyltransferase [Planosporangium mesophilum]|uniref:GNAT family N-acetyltransferase n=1 Tax=Planosporangium mesophilum TaxID=689768 RepID=UPI0035715254